MIATLVTTTHTTQNKHGEALGVIGMTTVRIPARSTSHLGTGAGKGRGRRLSLNSGNEEDMPMNKENKTRKTGYNEDVEGFQFTRKENKRHNPPANETPHFLPQQSEISLSQDQQQQSLRKGRPSKKRKIAESGQGFTTNDKDGLGSEASVAVSARPATGVQTSETVATMSEIPIELSQRTVRKRDPPDASVGVKKRRKSGPSNRKTEGPQLQSPAERVAGTSKIALPLADTPVIQRNKDMRGEKAGKKRRDSLGMRGRRASSLIDSGASNALPHKEVDIADFYKHIASDGLPEPRRMRQLLIWCATRAMGDKPSGSRSEDESARLAARVIQEELLKDFSTDSELSNWFGREDAEPPAVVVKKPNPKNVQNNEKIKELEEQIQRLQRERHALNALHRPTSIPCLAAPRLELHSNGILPSHQQLVPHPTSDDIPRSTLPAENNSIDTSLLDASQQAIVEILDSTLPKSWQKLQPGTPSMASLPPVTPSAISLRLSGLMRRLAPTLDTFAAGIQEIELYRATADAMSSHILRICAQRLEERDARNGLSRLAIDDDSAEGDRRILPHSRPRIDLGAILGALSRIDRL